MKKFVFIVLVVLVSCQAKPEKSEKQLTVFCAASLTNVVGELKELYQKQNSIDINLNLASTGTLARQIEQGAPADIFLSANQRWMDYIYSVGLTKDSTIVKCAGNTLVVVAPKQSNLDTIIFEDAVSFASAFKGRLSIGDPDYVPAGTYAVEALKIMNYYSALEDRLLHSKDVRSALMMVEIAEVEVGIVYKTDALSSEKVKIVGSIPDSTHQPIAYYSAIIKSSKNQESEKFHTFIQSKEAKSIWEKYGFSL